LATQSHLIGRKRHYLVSSNNHFASFYRELLMANSEMLAAFVFFDYDIDHHEGAWQPLWVQANGSAALQQAGKSAGADKPLVDGLRSRATVRAWSSIKSDTSLPCARR
jgi:hypothetical protein